jgi:hypothetical protein
MKRKTFVVSDSSLNAYGFRVLTQGLSWADTVPMFFNHNDYQPAIGHWENIRRDGDKILADAVFDEEDEIGKSISRKVENGHINASSCGLRGLEWSDNPKDLLNGQTRMSMTKGVIKEISICNIGANKNAIALYDDNEGKIDLKDETALVKLAINQKPPIQELKNSDNMENELKNIALALKLSEGSDEAAILKAIKALHGKNTELSLKVENFEETVVANQKKEREVLLNEAITAKKITEGDKAKWVKLFDADFDTAKDALATISPVVRLSDIPKTEVTPTGVTTDLKYQGKTWSELDKEGSLQKLHDTNYELFKAMHKAEFGFEYKK